MQTTHLDIILKTTGVVFWAYLLFKLLDEIYLRFLRSATSWKQFKGEWAIVTGSSYGIGESFAKSLAKRGINVVLIARSKDKLDNVAASIHEQYPNIQTRVIPIDMVNDEDAFTKIEKATRDINVSVLINNLGGVGNTLGGDKTAHHYHELPDVQEETARKLNIVSVTKLCKMMLTRMMEQKKGRIINISTVASLKGMPYLAWYSSDKGKLNTLTKSLHMEYGPYGIEIGAPVAGEVTTPGLLNSEFGKGTHFGSCHSEEFVELSLDQFGYRVMWIPSIKNLMQASVTHLPGFIIHPILRATAKSVYDKRKRNE